MKGLNEMRKRIAVLLSALAVTALTLSGCGRYTANASTQTKPSSMETDVRKLGSSIHQYI